MIKVIKLNSDNFQDQLVMPDAYEYITFQMSSGDYGSHSKESVYVSSMDNVITKQQLEEEDYNASLVCQSCGRML